MTAFTPYTRLKDNLADPRLLHRIGWTALTAAILFAVVTSLSYFLLPEGLLRNQHPLHNWNLSPVGWISSLQIFTFNLLSVVVMLSGNLFAQSKASQQRPFPIGLTAFFVLITIDALVLGTWSFSVIQPSVDLLHRFLRTFDLAHRGGLWEITGQMLIACATTGLARFITVDGKTTFLPLNAIRLSRAEWVAMLLGLGLMAVGAAIESAAILAVQ